MWKPRGVSTRRCQGDLHNIWADRGVGLMEGGLGSGWMLSGWCGDVTGH